jgi:hypothetical protein
MRFSAPIIAISTILLTNPFLVAAETCAGGFCTTPANCLAEPQGSISTGKLNVDPGALHLFLPTHLESTLAFLRIIGEKS